MKGRIIGGVGIIALSLLGATLGGCQEQKLKEENARLQQENDALANEKQQLTATIQAKDQQITGMSQQQPTLTGGTEKNWTAKSPSPAPRSETRIEVAGDKLFASGSTTMMAAGKTELDKVAARIKNEFPGGSVRVEGYTDTDPPNKIKQRFPTNEALSLERARQVEKYLVSRGVPSSRIEAVGMGAANPKATKAASRRVEVVVW